MVPILELILSKFPGASKTTARGWLKSGRILVGGESICDPLAIVHEDAHIEIQPKPRFLKGNIPILFEDRYFIALNKPKNLLSVDAEKGSKISLHKILKNHFRQPVFVVHRLDEETSGAILFAKEETAFTKIKELFKEHDIERKYLCIVNGIVSPPEGTWDLFLKELPNFNVVVVEPHEEGERAITHYKTLKTKKNKTLLELRLETGKKHQIRVHASFFGHPVLGDRRYGGGSAPRLFLHAQYLCFTHPITGKKVTISAPPPEEFLFLY